MNIRGLVRERIVCVCLREKERKTMLERERNNMSLCERVYETKNRDEC